MNEENIEICRTCRYFRPDNDHCLRYPPVPLVNIWSETEYGDNGRYLASVYSGTPIMVWAEVEEHDWCGEYQRKGES
jgi:hypothetical protein